MTKLTTTIIVCLISASMYGQGKGSFLAGGTIAFQSTKHTSTDENVNSFTFMPNAGYFFIDRLAGGLRVSFTKLSSSGDSFHDFLIGPFARYYFLRTEEKTNVFLEANFLAGNEKYESFDAEQKTQYGFKAGPAFFLSPHTALEASLEWKSVKYSDTEGRFNTFGIGIGFQVHLFGRSHKEGK